MASHVHPSDQQGAPHRHDRTLAESRELQGEHDNHLFNILTPAGDSAHPCREG